jgi:acetyl-CoA carboxylase, biotin carboxylase subunit
VRQEQDSKDGHPVFKKILIANRGEIAVRVIMACRELGIKTVAVYSEEDESSPHRRFADEHVRIGPQSTDSYLNMPVIISAAESTGADAIYPGYGFLSETSYFAEVCAARQIGFIGPDLRVARLLGDKTRARKVMSDAGLPILAGSDGLVHDEASALRVADAVGYPVVIKPAAGAGGRGIQIVRTAREMRDALHMARCEAEAAFANGDVYVEKYLENPRHIEFQVIGDHHGNVVHLGERECSIQRGHQKLLEESPSPSLTEDARRQMGSLVVAAAQAIRYTNAGTFEFLMDADGRFYYMETNARLQLEHCVTEVVTGVDIVKEQILIAAGERLSISQKDVRPTGHAIACRINAEDPETFVPSPGLIDVFYVVGGPGVRVDSLARSECTIPTHYDSVIATIIVHGQNRQEAIARMRRTLEMTIVEGVKTLLPLHLMILNEPDFQAGWVNASFMDRFTSKRELRTLPQTA